MELVINLSMLGPKPTGLGVYSEHCAYGIAERFNTKLIAGAGNLPNGEVLSRGPASAVIGAGRFAAIRRQLWMRSLEVGKNRLVYSPTHHGLPNLDGQIITVHDLICLRFPSQHLPQYLFFRFGLPRLLKKCRAVFTVSETTRQDIASTYGYPLERIWVVPNGVDVSEFSPDSTARPEEPFLLMAGARYSHKNVDEVLERSHLWSSCFKLVVTSCGDNYKKQLLRKAADLGVADRVVFLDYVSRQELIKLYQGCSALLYPSKWEGFGIPPLEALACGSPVIASDIPVHREVLGSAAFFVKLGDPDSWAEAFETINSPAQVEKKLNNAREILQRFTWENSVATLERSLLRIEPGLIDSRRENVASM